MTLHIATPLLLSSPLSRAREREVWLKMEALQPPGSFKIRGIGLACEQYLRQGARRFVSSSGGNAGLAVAYAGHHLGVAVTVVVPETASQRAIDLLLQEQAQVIIHGSSWQETNDYARSLLETTDAFLHPFDDPLLWRGHASMIDEIAQHGLKPDAVVLAVGGGGLLAGVVEGLQRNGWSDVPVLAVETIGAASLHAALAAGTSVELPAIHSIAFSLGARRVCEQARYCASIHPLYSLLVSDLAAVTACERFLDDHRVLVEPACGAGLSVVYDGHPLLADYRRILVIVCGGTTTTSEQLQKLGCDLRSAQ